MTKTVIVSAAFLVSGMSHAWANAPGGGYEGISAIYYGAIAMVLGYGVWDIFFKKD